MGPDEVRRLAEIERRKREVAAAAGPVPPVAATPDADDADVDSVPGDSPRG